LPKTLQHNFRTRMIRRALTTVFALLLLFLIVAWLIGGRLIAPANRTVHAPSDMAVTEFKVGSNSGSEIAGWSLLNEPGNPVVILLHPLRGSRKSMLGRARLLHDNGFSIVMIDLQSHGESPGENITLGHSEKHDVEAAVKYVKANYPESKIGIVGWSLGGASALLASPLDVDAMVLESVFSNVTDAVYDRVEMRVGPLKYIGAPILLAQLPMRLGISTDDLRPIDFMDKLHCPVMILAGNQDLHTPIDESQRMLDAANEPKELVTFAGASHEDLLAFDEDLYREKVVEFLLKNLRGKNQISLRAEANHQPIGPPLPQEAFPLYQSQQ